MKLILRDYISTLKEENELEGLLNNILFLDNYKEIISPQKGIRQHGVDLSCKKNNISYLFVIKQGNIDRNTWNGNRNSVRQSLDEIQDVYLQQNKNILAKKVIVILCTNGEILQEVKQDWDGYILRNNNENLSFSFWGLNELTNLTFDLIPNEYIIDQNKMTLLRKTLYFSNEYDNDLRYFKKLLNNILSELTNLNKKSREYKKSLCLYRLVSKMCSNEYIKNNNNRTAIRINELSMTFFWGFIIKNKRFQKNYESTILIDIAKEYEYANECYLKNIMKIAKYKPSFNIYNPIEYVMLFYESIGYLCTYTFYLLYYYKETKEKEIKENERIITTLLNNNPSAWCYPLYDLNSIEINCMLNMYYLIDKKKCIDIIKCIISRLLLKMENSNYHPIEIENYDKAVSLEFGDDIGDFESTNLIYCLLEWLTIFQEKEEINNVIDFLTNKYKNLTFNPWTITKDEEIAYLEKKDYHMGVYIEYEENLDYDGIKIIIKKSLEESNYKEMYSYKYSCEPYFLISAKVNRMPVPPFIYEKYFEEEDNNTRKGK
jgi:hypothetical protein